MLHPLAALPRNGLQPAFKHVACIYDIPSSPDVGRLDRLLVRRAWRRLSQADVVWSSDKYKARLAKESGGLADLPLICHNCPPRNYLPDPTTPRDGWLREQLRHQGAGLTESEGCVLLRAGAIGECGGIEATLEGMRSLPEDYVFVMMGRPHDSYKKHLLELIAALRLEHRAFLWDRPSDEVWKRALQGADLGHLIHGPFASEPMKRSYELNSSLSNNRLFQYMAAGLPIIAYNDPRLNDIYSEVPCFCVARLASLAHDIRLSWQELGTKQAFRVRLGGAGRRAHLKTFNWEFQFGTVLDRIRSASCRD